MNTIEQSTLNTTQIFADELLLDYYIMCVMCVLMLWLFVIQVHIMIISLIKNYTKLNNSSRVISRVISGCSTIYDEDDSLNKSTSSESESTHSSMPMLLKKSESSESLCSSYTSTSCGNQINIISVEGNIGSGKSTLIKILTEKYKNVPNVVFLLEPVSIWESIISDNGNNMIENLYNDTAKYAFSFQIMACSSRLKMIKLAIDKHQKLNNDTSLTIIMERSLDADHNVFAKMLFDDKLIKTEDYHIYNMLCDLFIQEYGTQSIIWLDVSPEMCYNQIKKRNRDGEDGVTLEYLQKCDAYHKSWFTSNNANNDTNNENTTQNYIPKMAITNFNTVDLTDLAEDSKLNLLLNNIGNFINI